VFPTGSANAIGKSLGIVFREEIPRQARDDKKHSFLNFETLPPLVMLSLPKHQ
jgi:hypothetical protein